MKVTIVYDNTVFKKNLQPDWGFSALVESAGRRILFDTGANDFVLLYNMEKLGIAPESIDDVFISHFHFDHTGGLSSLLEKNNSLKVWIPRPLQDADNINISIEVSKSGRLYDGIYSTGELEGIEQSLCVETEKGIIVIAGCSHPSLEHILSAASGFGKVYGIIGGLHANRPEALKNLDLICATHCTQFYQEIKALFPDKYIEGGAGQVIEI
ncbi:MAG: MBL fold metallo-hydrolase [Spirochaetes bacterium]|nr:MBL fold metallo-hydrolase [Spirochaetota bacterium]